MFRKIRGKEDKTSDFEEDFARYIENKVGRRAEDNKNKEGILN